MNKFNLNEIAKFQELKHHAQTSFASSLTPEKLQKYRIQASGLSFSYGTTSINDTIIKHLSDIAKEQKVFDQYTAMLQLEKINASENKAVSHINLRKSILESNTLDPILKFAETATYTDIVQIGIGGSILGPKTICHALSTFEKAKCHWHFISNIDTQEANAILQKVKLSTTLFIFASKSGTTLETLENYDYIHQFCEKNGMKSFSSQAISITTQGSPMDDPERFFKHFYIPDTVGGRFSTTSAIGALMIILVFGKSVYLDFIRGALAMDENARVNDITKNMALMASLLFIWHFHVLNYSSWAIVPYAYAFSYLPLLLQQLFCESLGKSENIQKKTIPYVASPVVFGDIGTNAQHSFFQLLHQGNQVVPIHFISIKNHHSLLNQNLTAQVATLSLGHPKSGFPGNKPCTILQLQELSAETLGALLAFYENWVIFTGFLLNVNPFDQPGVELAKEMAKTLHSQPLSPLLKAFNDLIT